MPLLAAAALVCGAEAAAAADVEVYGVIDLGLLYQSEHPDFASDPDAKSTSSLQMKSGTNKGSRFGFRGSEQISPDLSVKFVLENGFDADSGSILFGDRLFGRQATLAAAGPWGELAFGRTGSLASGAGTYALAGWLTPFDTGLGAWSVAASNYMFGFQRLDNSVTYVSPAWKSFRLHAQYSFSADLKNDHSAEEGIQNGSEGKSSADRYWAAAMTYKQGPIDFAFIVDSYQWSSDIAKNAVYEGAVRDFDDSLAVMAGGSWNFGFLKAYAGVQWFQNAWKSWIGGGLFKVNSAADTQGVWGRDRYQDGWATTAGADFDWGPGRAAIGAAYLSSESSLASDDAESERWGLSLAYTYPLSKTAALYWIGSWMHDEHRNVRNAAHEKLGGKNEVDGFESAVGLYKWF